MIVIRLTKQFYFPKQIVEGCIELRTEKTILVKDMKLRLYRTQEIQLQSTNEMEAECILDEKKILKERTYDFCKNIEIGPGMHQFPFKMKIGVEETGTGVCKGYFYDSIGKIENRCMLQGICTTSEDEYIVEKEICIFDGAQDSIQTDVKIKTSTLLCLLNRSVVYRLVSDKLWYCKGDNITIDCSLLTPSKQPIVSGVSGKVYQIMTMKKNGNNIFKSRHLITAAGFPSSRNRFQIKFRIPMNACPSIVEKQATSRTVIIFEISLFNGSVMKVRKYLNVGDPCFDLPSLDEKVYEKGLVFVERVIEC